MVLANGRHGSWTKSTSTRSQGARFVQSVVPCLHTVALSALDVLTRFLMTGSVTTIKAVIPIFSSIYPLIFRLLATSRPPQQVFDAFNTAKSRIISLALDPSVRPQSRGVKAAAWKFIQKVLLAATRAPAADPRVSYRLCSMLVLIAAEPYSLRYHQHLIGYPRQSPQC